MAVALISLSWILDLGLCNRWTCLKTLEMSSPDKVMLSDAQFFVAGQGDA